MKKTFLIAFAIVAFFAATQYLSTIPVHACSDPHWSYCDGDPTPTPTPCPPGVTCPDPGVGRSAAPSPSPEPKDDSSAHWYDFIFNIL